jgi:hypothetical protein
VDFIRRHHNTHWSKLNESLGYDPRDPSDTARRMMRIFFAGDRSIVEPLKKGFDDGQISRILASYDEAEEAWTIDIPILDGT